MMKTLKIANLNTNAKKSTLDHLPLKHHNPTDPGILVDLDDPVWPFRVQGLQVLTAFLDNKLFEGGLCGVFNHDDHILSMDRIDMRIHEDQVAIMELGFHADTAYAQDVRIVAATDGAG